MAREIKFLTDSEEQLLEMYEKGYSTSYISEKLCLEKHTLNLKSSIIYAKLFLNNQTKYDRRAAAVIIYKKYKELKEKSKILNTADIYNILCSCLD